MRPNKGGLGFSAHSNDNLNPNKGHIALTMGTFLKSLDMLFLPRMRICGGCAKVAANSLVPYQRNTPGYQVCWCALE